MKIPALFISILAATTLTAQSLESYERVLLPVYASVNGYRSSYHPVVNSFSEQPVPLWPASGEGGGFGVIPAGRSQVALRDLSGAGGRVMFIQPGNGQLQLDLKVSVVRNIPELSPKGPDFTFVRIPVVPEDQFLKGDSRIIGVPFAYFNERDIGVGACCEVRAQFRHMLRIYDLSAEGGAEVMVRVEHPGAPDGRIEHRVRVSSRDGNDASYPWYAQVPLENYCFQVWPSSTCASFFGVVELEPADPTREYWAFVTSTHNLTHDIAVSMP